MRAADAAADDAGKRVDERKRVAVRLAHDDERAAAELAALHGYESLGRVGALERHFVFQELPQHLRRCGVRRWRNVCRN